MVGLDEAAALYDLTVEALTPIRSCCVDGPAGRRIDWNLGRLLRDSLVEAAALEERAVAVFKRLTAAGSDPNEAVVPRWGAAPPR